MAEPYLETLSKKITSLELSTFREVALECKHFFSGAALYANGKVCASLTPAGFGLKLPQKVRDRMVNEGKGKELRYFENAPVKREYIALSQAIVEDPTRIKSLLVQSIDYVLERERAAHCSVKQKDETRGKCPRRHHVSDGEPEPPSNKACSGLGEDTGGL